MSIFKKSIVSDLISYEPLDRPSWRDPDMLLPDKMIDQIVGFQKEWNTLEKRLDADRIKEVKKKFKERFCDATIGHWKNESEKEQKKQESDNLMKMIEYLEQLVTEETRRVEQTSVQRNLNNNCGLVEKSMLQGAHKIVLEGIKSNEGLGETSQPGEFSPNPRCTDYNEENYNYPQPEDMGVAVDLICDHFNSLIHDSRSKTDDKEKVKQIFKTAAWFLFEILDLHPFGDGNGRLFITLVCSYILPSASVTVVPFPIYYACNEIEKGDHSNCSKPCKDCYKQALVDARKSNKRHPSKLATMLIEFCWRTWKEVISLANDLQKQEGIATLKGIVW